jgi:hypothetical protein
MNSALKIFGLLLTFCAFAYIGYICPIGVGDKYSAEAQPIIKRDSSPKPTNSSSNIGNGNNISNGSLNTQTKVETPSTTEGQNVATVSNVNQTQTQHYNSDVFTANDIKVMVDPRTKYNHSTVSRSAIISVSGVSGRVLECIIEDVNTSAVVKSIQLRNGRSDKFSVPPVEGGEYRIVVRDVQTGYKVSKIAAGFGMIKKWDAAKVQEQFNVEVNKRDELIRHHFDLGRLKISCIESLEEKNSFDELWECKTNGIKVVVVGTPEDDKYNRIIHLTVKVN